MRVTAIALCGLLVACGGGDDASTDTSVADDTSTALNDTSSTSETSEPPDTSSDSAADTDPTVATDSASEVEVPDTTDPTEITIIGARFYCAEKGSERVIIAAKAYFFSQSQISEAHLVLIDDEPTVCEERPQLHLTSRVDARREDTTIVTSDARKLDARVTTQPPGTRHAQATNGPFYIDYLPKYAGPAAGPDTITATNAGATLTATRDSATGEYTTLVDDPSLWDLEAIARVSFGGGAPVDVPPPPPLNASFGASARLDTPITLDADSLAALSIVLSSETLCAREGNDQVLSVSWRATPEDDSVTLRELYGAVAETCGTSVDLLVAFSGGVVEITATERTTIDALDVLAQRAWSIDLVDINTDCSGNRPTFCTSQCVNLASDPNNCGGCGQSPREICDGTLDNDCDGATDETCPTQVIFPFGNSHLSPIIGDTTTLLTGNSEPSCNGVFVGLCGATNSDGSIRHVNPLCANVALQRTGADQFDILITETAGTAGNCPNSPVPAGGTPFIARCPANMALESVGVAYPSAGRVGSIALGCAAWTVEPDPTHGWVIRRGEQASADAAGSGPGELFMAFAVPLDGGTGNPGALRYLRYAYLASGPSANHGTHNVRFAGDQPTLNGTPQ